MLEKTTYSFSSIGIGMLVSQLLFFYTFPLVSYLCIVSYATFVDLQRTACATVLGPILILCVSYITPFYSWLVLLDLVDGCILFVLSTLGMCIMRISVKRMFDVYRIEDVIPVAIYGTKAGGIR